MAIFSRAKKDSASAQIQNARFELDRITGTIADRRLRRGAALLGAENGDFSEVSKLDGELASLEGEAKLWRDRIEALEVVAARETAEQVARRKAAHVERVEGKLAARVKAAAELEELIASADAKFREVISLSEECAAAWPFDTGVLVAAALGPVPITALVKHALYKTGARPFVGGRAGEVAQPSFPGGVCPRNDWAGVPEKIPSLSNSLQEGNAYASRIMRGGPR